MHELNGMEFLVNQRTAELAKEGKTYNPDLMNTVQQKTMPKFGMNLIAPLNSYAACKFVDWMDNTSYDEKNKAGGMAPWLTPESPPEPAN